MRVVKRIDFTEISVVRKPAAEAAKAVLMKSADHKQFTGETVAIVDIGSNVLTKLATPEPAKTKPVVTLIETEKNIMVKTNSSGEWNAFVKQVKERNKRLSFEEATAQARRENPELFKAHMDLLNGEGEAKTTAHKVVAKVNSETKAAFKKMSADFSAKVKEIQKRDNADFKKATQTARQEYPDLYEAFYN